MPEDLSEDADVPLKAWSRWLTGTAGVALLVTGAIGVFINGTNVAGVPIFIVAGVALLYVALTGQRLIQVNKDGVTFGRIRKLEKTLRQVAEDPEIPAETKSRIADVAEDNGLHLAPIAAYELESQVQSLFEDIGHRYGFVVVPSSRGEVDFVLVNRHGRQVPVEVRARLRLREFSAVINRLRQFEAEYRVLVIDGALPEVLVESYRADFILILKWDSHAEAEWIRQLRGIEFLTDER